MSSAASTKYTNGWRAYFKGCSLSNISPNSVAILRKLSSSLTKKPNLDFVPARLDEKGYFTIEAKVVYVRTNPPLRRPSNWCVSIRKAFAFPSKCVKSSHSIGESCSPFGCFSFRRTPFPSEKKVEIAFSPE